MNITIILNKLENLPEELRLTEKRKEFLFNLENQFLKRKNWLEKYRYSNEAGLIALEQQISITQKEIKELEYKIKFLKEEIKFYKLCKVSIEEFLEGNDYEKEIYREKYLNKYSMTKISIRHNNIQANTINNIIKKVEKDVQKFLNEYLFHEWLNNNSLVN